MGFSTEPGADLEYWSGSGPARTRRGYSPVSRRACTPTHMHSHTHMHTRTPAHTIDFNTPRLISFGEKKKQWFSICECVGTKCMLPVSPVVIFAEAVAKRTIRSASSDVKHSTKALQDQSIYLINRSLFTYDSIYVRTPVRTSAVCLLGWKHVTYI